MAKLRFDDKAVRGLDAPAGANRIDYDMPAANGRGEFVRGFAVRTTRAGTKTFLLVYVAKNGMERRLRIGDLGPFTVSTARAEARRLRVLVDTGADPFMDVLRARSDAEAARARQSATLGGLLDAYVEYLRAARKPSAGEVATFLDRNLWKPYPKLARLPLEDVCVEAVLPALHRLTRVGKWRAAEKLAVYLRAAFNAAKSARTDAAGFHFHSLNVRSNPLAELRVSRPAKPAEGAGELAQRKWALSLVQLQAYWKRISIMPSPHGALLRFHLLTGAQRMEQLSRLSVSDLNFDNGTVTLWDSKGRRSVPRAHVLPVIPDAQLALDDMRGGPEAGPYLFTVSNGVAPAVPHTLAADMRKVSKAMRSADEIERDLTPGAIRRTVETLLAESGVSKEVRAQLLSHGIGGVQDRHYDAGDYLRQKREALTKLRSMLDSMPNVVAFAEGARAIRRTQKE